MDIKLERTCGACPEQYDALDENNNIIGYLRLRHGHFYTACPDVGGTIVYSAYPEGDGMFTDRERPFYLKKALEAIRNYYLKEE